MTSALTPRGSTSAWRRLRALHQATLPLPCWRCGQTINPTDRWQLGHLIDRADGGTDAHLAPEHAHCGSSAGATAQAARARNATTRGRPSPPVFSTGPPSKEPAQAAAAAVLRWLRVRVPPGRWRLRCCRIARVRVRGARRCRRRRGRRGARVASRRRVRSSGRIASMGTGAGWRVGVGACATAGLIRWV